MARTCTYLNFANCAEEAFRYYASVFGTSLGEISRFKDMPPSPDTPPLTPEQGELVMHIELPLLGGHALMGCDVPEAMGFKVVEGNNVYINVEPDSRAEADRLFAALSAGGAVEMALADMFWGAYFGSCTDKFGIHWMVNFATKA